MKKIFLFLFFLLNFTFAQNFFKIGYGTNGYRLGLDLKANSYFVSYISLFAENEYEDGDFIINRIAVNASAINGTTVNNIRYSYVLNNIYLNLGLMFYTKIKNLYITPFVKIRRTYFKIENATFSSSNLEWDVGGGINFVYFAYIAPGFVIVPQVYVYYIPQETYYFNGQKITETGKETVQLGAALDLNIGFNY